MLLTLCPVFICSLILLLPVSKTPLSNHETHRAKGWGKKVKMVKVIQHTDWSEFLTETLSRFSHEDSLMLECSNTLLKPGPDRV